MQHSYCRNCLREAPEGICPHCGYDPEQEDPALPESVILNGRYLTGRILSSTDAEIVMLGLDLAEDRKVCMHQLRTEASLPAGVTVYDTFRENDRLWLITAPDQLIFPPIPKLKRPSPAPEQEKRSAALPIILITLGILLLAAFGYLYIHLPAPFWGETKLTQQTDAGGHVLCTTVTDTAGTILHSTRYQADGSVFDRTVYHYSAAGAFLGWERYRGFSEPDERCVSVRGLLGRVKQLRYFSADGTLTRWVDYTYTSSGETAQMREYLPDGSLQRTVSLEPQPDGTRAELSRDAEGRLTQKILRTESGSTRTTYAPDGTAQFIIETTQTETGYSELRRDLSSSAKERRDYDHLDRLTRLETYYSDGTTAEVTEYRYIENTPHRTVTTYARDGSVLKTQEFAD